MVKVPSSARSGPFRGQVVVTPFPSDLDLGSLPTPLPTGDPALGRPSSVLCVAKEREPGKRKDGPGVYPTRGGGGFGLPSPSPRSLGGPFSRPTPPRVPSARRGRRPSNMKVEITKTITVVKRKNFEIVPRFLQTKYISRSKQNCHLIRVNK